MLINPKTTGIHHIALRCTDMSITKNFYQNVLGFTLALAKALTDAGVDNTGVKLDETLQKNYVAFKDPDRIQWEFYMI